MQARTIIQNLLDTTRTLSHASPRGMRFGRHHLAALLLVWALVVLLSATALANTIAPGPVGSCISIGNPCVTVPVGIARTDAVGMRGFSVNLTLSADLVLCGAGIAEGTYLSSAGLTSFQVLDNGGGSYTVDCAILGLPCGAVAASGLLFELSVGSASPGGTGTVTINSVVTRDCANQPIASSPGAVLDIPIDNVAPTGIAALAAAQDKTANDADGTTKVDVSWPAVEAGATVEVYRAGFGNYPEYDDAPGAGSVPATPGYPPGAPWALAASVSGVTAIADEVANRDFWYYVAFVKDGCGNVSLVSNQTGGTLNYHLGDVHNTIANCAGDNAVSTADISFLGGNYGAVLGASDPRACLDVGPTTDLTVDARPTTDNQLQFEDLVLFAVNHGDVSAPQDAIAGAATDELSVSGPAAVSAGEEFTAIVRMKGTGAVQAVSAALAWNEAIAEPLGVMPGAWLEGLNGVALSPARGVVDAAALGMGLGLRGEGELAVVRFRARAAGSPGITVARIEARDAANRSLPIGGVAGRPDGVAASRTALGIAAPNPFAGSTTVNLSLSRAGRVKVAAYDLGGRLVRVLVDGEMGAGARMLTWDGRDEAGARLAPGAYVLRLEAGEIVQSRQVRVVR
jgi:hypothetical protein